MREDRRFTDKDVRRIFAGAAERQYRTDQDHEPGWSLDELEEAAAAAGIDAVHVREAAADLLRGGHAPIDRELFGLPIELRRSITFPGVVDDEEWTEIVEELRRTFGKTGVASRVGYLREWSSESDQRREPIHVTVETVHAGTRVSIEHNTSRMAISLGTATASQFFVGLILSLVAMGGTDDVWIPAVIFLALAVCFGVGSVAGMRLRSKSTDRRINEVLGRIVRIHSRAPIKPAMLPDQEDDAPIKTAASGRRDRA